MRDRRPVLIPSGRSCHDDDSPIPSVSNGGLIAFEDVVFTVLSRFYKTYHGLWTTLVLQSVKTRGIRSNENEFLVFLSHFLCPKS